MQENIKDMYKQMTEANKAVAVTTTADHFNMAETTVKNVWLYGSMNIPEEKQPKVVEIFQNVLRGQLSTTEATIANSLDVVSEQVK